MTISEFIKINLHTDDVLPFATPLAHFKKHAELSKIGVIEKYGYFIQEGIVQAAIESHGEEKIIDFFLQDQFVSSYTSFLTQKPSDVVISAVTDCVVEVIDLEKMQAAYATSIVTNQLGRYAIEKVYIKRIEREKSFLTKSAPEKYLELITYHPEIVELMSVAKVAKYLGIHPESLSRIRKTVHHA
jgi:Cyclic nucleotide-binding domain